MTTARRVKMCGSCGFADDHMLHYRNCVPTSQWPRDLRERKAAAMSHGTDDIMEIDGQRFNAGPIHREVVERPPEPEKPRGIAEYRRLHPEANPLTAENITVREFRKREDGVTDEWERVVGVKEAMKQSTPCPRCQRPLLDRAMHITCQPIDGSVIPVPTHGRLQRDDVPLTPRHPVVHTTADVRQGAAWYEGMPEAEEPPVDEDEMRDFIAPEPTLAERLAAEQAAWTPADEEQAARDSVAAHEQEAEADRLLCPVCGRYSKSPAGNVTHQRSHRKA